MATAAISYDVSDFAGVDFDPARTKVYATNNAEDGVIHDVLGNKQYIGSGNGVASDNPKRSVGADGTGTITVPIPGAGFIPASWQTTIHFDGPDRNDPRRGRKTVSFGPYTITASGTLGSLIEEQAIPATYINQVTAQLDAKVTEAEAAADAAATSAAQAQSVADIDTPDALVATLVPSSSGSATSAALLATFATGGEVRSKVKTDGTDQTATLQGEINAARSFGAVTLILPSGTITLNGTITLGNDGATPPKQPALVLRGQGAHWSGRGTAPQGGTILDIKGTDTYGKIKTSGLGLLGITGVTFKDSSGGTTPFLYTTNTTLHIDQCAFVGSKTGVSCDQDAIILGGPNQIEGGGALTDGFQGYGTVLSRNFFSGIRTCIKGQAFANAVVVRDNTVWTTCGNASGAAIEWNGAPGAPTTQYATGNVLSGNLIEVPNYKYAIRLVKCANFTIEATGVFDKTATTTAGIHIDATSTSNVIREGFTAAGLPPIQDLGLYTWFYPASQGVYANLPPAKYLDTSYPTTIRRLIVDGVGSLGFLVQPYEAQSNAQKMIEFKRSAAEATDPGASIWYIQQNGQVVVDPTAANGGNWTGPFCRWQNGGRTWSGVGTATGQTNGSTMTQDSGPGGSYFDMKNYAVRFYDHNGGPLRVTIGAGANQIRFGAAAAINDRPGIISGAGTPEGTVTAPVGSMFLRSDGGAGTTMYVKESGTGNTGWVAK